MIKSEAQKWPVGKERQMVGSINPYGPLAVKISFDEIDEVSRLDLTIFGGSGESISRRLPCQEDLELQMTDAEADFVRNNGQCVYALIARMYDGTDRVITKGRTSWQKDT